ncbi:MAG TPA: PEP-CTERM sorting domain-containing protein [Lacipirellulaceae bacterium]|nr:PEP-CTERM sorting domain-containing protein [Lacipirellulaceae bacterium]
MKKRIAKSRRQASRKARPSATFSKRLASYATAAGLGAFSYGETARAGIVYVDLDPDLVNNTASTFTPLDLDGNGTVDFLFGQTTLNYAGVRIVVFGHPLFQPPEDRLPAGELSRNFTNSLPASGKGNQYYIRSFEFGDVIGPGLPEPIFLGSGYPNFNGNVATNANNFGKTSTPQYWGFGLNINGAIHYGWGRVSTIGSGGSPNVFTATLYEYAYQSEPGVPIMAGQVPEPTSLAMLAAGGGGLALASRRKRRS